VSEMGHWYQSGGGYPYEIILSHSVQGLVLL